MTTPTPVHEAAMKAVDTIMSLTDSPVSIFSVRSYHARCVDIIEAKFAPIVEKAELADELAKALEGDACLIHEKNLSGEHAVDNFDVCPVPRCINRRKLIAAYEAAQKASTP